MAKKQEEDDILTYHGRTEREFYPGVANQSLVESVRDSLPEGETHPALIFLATKQPGLYSTFLGKLIAGSSFRAAAMACGLPYDSIVSWLKQGAIDLADDVDTYCGRMLLDCQRAASLAITDTEERVFTRDPEKWLSRGPGKIFFEGTMWAEPKQERLEQRDGQLLLENPLDPEVPADTVVESEVLTDDGSKDLSDALKVLEDHQITTSPEFYKQAREQFGLKDTKENE